MGDENESIGWKSPFLLFSDVAVREKERKELFRLYGWIMRVEGSKKTTIKMQKKGGRTPYEKI